MNDKDAALMRSWAEVALRNEGIDHRRDIVARFVMDSVDDPYGDIEVGSVWIARFEGEERVAVRGKTEWYLCETEDHFAQEAEVVELVSKLVPESTPDHPTELTTEADYRNAPTGTIVAAEGAEAWIKDLDGLWEAFGIISGYTNYAMAGEARQVLRRGWAA